MNTKPVPAGCGQSRWPERRGGAQQEAGSACSELLEDDEATERRFRATARFWTLYAAVVLVAICAGIAHFLPALKALVN